MSIRGKTILLLALSLCLHSNCLAKEKVNIKDKIIGSTFKTLAKTLVMAVDFNKLKKDNINKINKMDEEKFKKRYAKAYKVIKDLPVNLKVRCAITEQMNREQAIKNIKSLDKKKLYVIIDSIPDTFIASCFKRYLNEKKQTLQKSNMVEQINKFWNKVLQRSKISTSSCKPPVTL